LSNGSSNWIYEALRRHEAPLLRYATALCGATLAPDVVQDTFLRLCRQTPEDVLDHVTPWLFRVCRNRALELKRNDRSETSPDVQVPVAPPPHASAERQQLLSLALYALDELPAKQKEVVLLKFSGELSYREISEVTGLSVSHVGVILHEALKKVRSNLRERGVLATEPPTPTAAVATKRRAL